MVDSYRGNAVWTFARMGEVEEALGMAKLYVRDEPEALLRHLKRAHTILGDMVAEAKKLNDRKPREEGSEEEWRSRR
jgi:hypothetical protein